MNYKDNEFDYCQIVAGEFEETKFSEEGEDDFDDYGYGVCPKCRTPLTFETDAL